MKTFSAREVVAHAAMQQSMQSKTNRISTTGTIEAKNILVNEELEKKSANLVGKKIRKMSSLQMKRHQRQFGVLHFLINGMEEFVGNLSMDPAQKKSFIIVYGEKTIQAANFLLKQFEEIEKRGIAVNAVLYSSNKFEKLPKKDENLSEKIIYVGDFTQSKKVRDSIHYWL